MAHSASSPEQMLAQGFSMTRYFERFGGWSNCRELALVAHQVALTFDAFQAGASKGSCGSSCRQLGAGLLGRRAYGSGLPAHLAGGSALRHVPRPNKNNHIRTRAFSALASQRWITVVLGYLRELDTIQARSAQQGKPSKASASSSAENPDSTPNRPKRQPKKKQPPPAAPS